MFWYFVIFYVWISAITFAVTIHKVGLRNQREKALGKRENVDISTRDILLVIVASFLWPILIPAGCCIGCMELTEKHR